VLARLAALTGDSVWRDRAGELLGAFAGQDPVVGLQLSAYLGALDWHLSPPTHLVVVGRQDDPRVAAMHRAALAGYAPRRVVQRIEIDKTDRAALPAAVRGMLDRQTFPAGYACRGDSCSPPATTDSEWHDTLLFLRSKIKLPTP
jgi:uncharacterized protein YyaL (SSP411 family)